MRAYLTCVAFKAAVRTIVVGSGFIIFGCAIEPSDQEKQNKVAVKEIVSEGNFANAEGSTDESSKGFFESTGVAAWLIDNCSECHAETQAPTIANSSLETSYEAVQDFITLTKPEKSRLVVRLNEGHNCPGECPAAAADLTGKIAEWAAGVADAAVANLSFQTSTIDPAQIATAGIYNFPGNDPGYLYFPADAAALINGTATEEGMDPNQIGELTATSIQVQEGQTDFPKKARNNVRVDNAILPADLTLATPDQLQRVGIFSFDITVQSAGLYRVSAYVASGGGRALAAFDPGEARDLAEYKTLGFSHQTTPNIPATEGYKWMHFDNATFELTEGKHTLYIMPGAGGNNINWAEFAVSRVLLPDNLGDLAYSDAYRPGQLLFPLTPVSEQIALSVELEVYQGEDGSAFLIQSMSIIYGTGAPDVKVSLGGVYPVIDGEVKLDVTNFADLEAVVTQTEQITDAADSASIIPFETMPTSLGFAINELGSE